MSNKQDASLVPLMKFGTLISIIAIVIIGVLVWKGMLHFHWTYIAAPKLFWTIFFSMWLWDIYFYILFWIQYGIFYVLSGDEKNLDKDE